MTGYTDDELVREYDKHGFRAAILKPFGLKELGEAMAIVLHS